MTLMMAECEKRATFGPAKPGSGELLGDVSGSCWGPLKMGVKIVTLLRPAPRGSDVAEGASDPTPTRARGQDDVSITRKLPQIKSIDRIET